MRLVIPGRPVPASRPRVAHGHAYYPRRYEDWKTAAAWLVRSTGQRFDGPVRVAVVVRRDSVEVEVSSSAVRRPTSVRGDIDNLSKAALDALQAGGLLVNDSQVVELVASFGGEA
jgi:Holliday junction resolvase RusA-like endonuclease